MELPTSTKQKHFQRLQRLKNERTSWISHWRDIYDHLRPRGARWQNDKNNDGRKKNQFIINSRPTVAARTLVAGIMSGLTSPSRPWFHLTTVDTKLADRDDVKSWLYAVEEIHRDVMLKSNIYECLHQSYWDLVLAGTSVTFLESDRDSIVRGYTFPVGQWNLTSSARGTVNTMYREARLTVAMLVEKFGLEACSDAVQSLYANGQFETWFDVVHCITPNTSYSEGKVGPKGFAFTSVWFEAGGEDKLLSEGGYHEQPFFAPRWMRTDDDVYGTSPAMDCLGDVRALQTLEKRKAKLIDKMADPPMRGPSSLQHQHTTLLPGEVTFVDASAPGLTFAPAHEIPPAAIQVVAAEITTHEGRIREVFYADLWLAMSEPTGNMTAREVIERREEKLLQLGPVVDSLHNELLSPLFTRLFAELTRQGLLPPPPKDLQGQALKVEYTSIMAQAQKLLGKTGIDSLFGFVQAVAAVQPNIVDKIDTDQAVDQYATILGTPPMIVRTDEDVDAIRQQRAKAQQQQQQMMQAEQAANTAQKLSASPLDDKNALSEMLRGVGAQ